MTRKLLMTIATLSRSLPRSALALPMRTALAEVFTAEIFTAGVFAAAVFSAGTVGSFHTKDTATWPYCYYTVYGTTACY